MRSNPTSRNLRGQLAAAMLAFCFSSAGIDRAAAQAAAEKSSMFANVGSFTTAQRKARGDGIHV